MKTKLMAAAAALLVSFAPAPLLAGADHGRHTHGAAFSAGEPGNASKPSRIVLITMTEADGKMLFTPSRLEIRSDEQIMFVLRNRGELDHEFVLATTEDNLKHAGSMTNDSDMEHDDPNAKWLAPQKTGHLVWRFTKPGEFEYACLIPGHREAGMIGTVVVK